MFKFKNHDDSDTRPQGSIDGFKSRDEGFKPNTRNSSLSFDVSKDLDSEIPESFPGLRSTFQQPTSHIDEDIVLEDEQVKPKRRRKFRPLKWLKRTAIAATVLVLLIGGWLFVKGYLTVQKVFNDDGTTAAVLNRNVEPTQLTGEGDGRLNILLLGKGGDGHEGADLTDSITIASIDPFAKTGGLLSIPRDLYVDVPDFWSMKINAAYAIGKQRSLDSGESPEQAEIAGLNTIKATIEEYIGIPIHYHVMVDFFAFQGAVDAIGGLDINVEDRLYDSTLLPDFLLDVYPGQQTFDGETTLYYVRSRYTSPRGDFDRAERQRAVLLALRDQILSVGTFANPIAINNLLDVIGDNVQTNMSLDELLQIYDITKEIAPDTLQSLSFVDDPLLVTTSFIGDQSVVIPRAGVSDYSEIQNYVRNQLIDGFLNQEQATVTVLNGSGIAGRATAQARELESYGYNVVSIENAPTSDYLDTVLIDRTRREKKYTRHYLEQRLNVSAIEGDPRPGLEAYTSDFVIIIGANDETSN